MLNRSIHLQQNSGPQPWITGRAAWRCPRGHLTTTSLHFDGRRTIGSSAWDRCGRCPSPPSPPQDIRLHLDIFAAWLAEKRIDRAQYRQLAHGLISRDYLPDDPAESLLGLPFRPGRTDVINALTGH